MKFRRSLTLAAATAAMAPAVLLTAPGAYATDDASPASATTVTAVAEDDSSSTEGDSTPPTGDSTPSDDANDSTGPGGPGSVGDSGEKAGTGTGADGSAGEGQGGSAGEDEAGKGRENAAEDPSKPGSDGPKGEDEPTGNWCGPYHSNNKLFIPVGRDFPHTVVAGSGFHPFTLHVINDSDHDIKSLELGISTRTYDFETRKSAYKYLAFQYKHPAAGTWADVDLGQWGSQWSAGRFVTVDVAAHESLTVDMRMSVAGDAPAGIGEVDTSGWYTDDDGNSCSSYTDITSEFNIDAAGTDTGNPPETEPGTEPGTKSGTEPQGGRNENTPTPTATVTNGTNSNGHLAQTGAGSALPAIALAGGLAVCAGVGAVYVVRRRKATGAGTTA
ncbi:LPXTG cell wall anchor domain-containing protein [Streptomyces sp. NPDC091412]|uniref:LPXTG cell wall anchor domain-containing protein n=1 Tax=Streptomyces sp. NPDC091412 TaxID=3366002 RepID=UPI00380897B4